MPFQALLDKYGLKFDDLNTAERETLMTWAKEMQTRPLTTDDVKSHVSGLILALQRELAGLDEPKSFWEWLFRRKRDQFAKARLKNYLMLQDFISAPDKAKAFVEQHIKHLKNN
jgi:hypothetical protein